jgi:hypothetical protein
MKSRRMRWAEHVARMGAVRNVCKVLVGKLEERDYLGDIGIDGRIILKCALKELDMRVWTGFV